MTKIDGFVRLEDVPGIVGAELLDLTSSYGALNHGHNHPRHSSRRPSDTPRLDHELVILIS